MEVVIFYIFSAIALVSGVLVVWHPHPVKSALALIVTFFSMGGLYLLLQAEFIALMQVLVYAGAVMVLFLFVIMLLNLQPRTTKGWRIFLQSRWSIAVVVVMVGMILSAIYHPLAELGQRGVQDLDWVQAQGGNIRAVGQTLFQDYLLPFEVTSILLLIAVVGVVVLAKRDVK